jgi:predicted DCC family thiol-disulfide oxidoreductase YuxK
LTDNPTILFDGFCNLCAACVRFIIRRDKRSRFRFASIQSDAGQSLMRRSGLQPEEIDSLVLIDGDKGYTKSDAALRIARGLPGLWQLLALLLVLPAPLRNWCYDLVAKKRYDWFGCRTTCLIPGREDRERFLG